jgi:Ca2+-binding RTX toxin-like protein
MLYAPSAGYNPSAIWLFNATQPGETIHRDILIEGNDITVAIADAVPARQWLSANASPLVAIQFFSNISFRDNDIDLVATSANSRGVVVYDSTDIAVVGNHVRGGGIYPIEFYNTSNFTIDGNDVSQWNDALFAGIIAGQASNYTITNNVLHDTAGGVRPLMLSIYQSDPALSLAGNLRVSGQDASLAGSVIENLTLAGAAVIGIGNGLNNVITGNAGANQLHGAGGIDTLIGLGGNDIYYTDYATTQVVEAIGGGNDQLYSSVSYVLGAGSEVELLSTNSHAATTAINLTGNAFNQTLLGNEGVNLLHGGGGVDVLIGYGGNDIYYTDVAATQPVEAMGGGFDQLYSSVSYVLGSGEIELLSTNNTAGTGAINLTGNNFGQMLLGNDGVNLLHGGGGVDVLVGYGGNDIYYTDVAATQVVEGVGGGNDQLYTSVSYVLGAGAEVELLSANDSAATAAINLTGSSSGQLVLGNAGANVLDGKGGADTLVGYGGADTFAFTSALGAGNVDVIADFVSGTDKIALDDAVFTALGLGALSANTFVIGSAALDADDRIIYNSSNGALYYDADGAGGQAAVQFATLSGAPALTASDFTVI